MGFKINSPNYLGRYISIGFCHSVHDRSIGQASWASASKQFEVGDDEAGNLGEDQGLFSAALPALVTGFLALAFSSLFSQTLSVNATATSTRESFPLFWALPIGYEGRNTRRVDPVKSKIKIIAGEGSSNGATAAPAAAEDVDDGQLVTEVGVKSNFVFQMFVLETL